MVTYMVTYKACGHIYVRPSPTYILSKLSYMAYMLINVIIYDNIYYLYDMYVDLYGKIYDIYDSYMPHI